MSYVAVLTYEPGQFGPGGALRKGAWRVLRLLPSYAPAGATLVVEVGIDYSKQREALFMDVVRPLRVGTYVNPTKLLRELFAKRRPNILSTTPQEKAA